MVTILHSTRKPGAFTPSWGKDADEEGFAFCKFPVRFYI